MMPSPQLTINFMQVSCTYKCGLHIFFKTPQAYLYIAPYGEQTKATFNPVHAIKIVFIFSSSMFRLCVLHKTKKNHANSLLFELKSNLHDSTSPTYVTIRSKSVLYVSLLTKTRSVSHHHRTTALLLLSYISWNVW